MSVTTEIYYSPAPADAPDKPEVEYTEPRLRDVTGQQEFIINSSQALKDIEKAASGFGLGGLATAVRNKAELLSQAGQKVEDSPAVFRGQGAVALMRVVLDGDKQFSGDADSNIDGVAGQLQPRLQGRMHEMRDSIRQKMTSEAALHSELDHMVREVHAADNGFTIDRGLGWDDATYQAMRETDPGTYRLTQTPLVPTDQTRLSR